MGTIKRITGRPTAINDEVLEKAWDYIENYKVIYGDEIPTVAGLACEMGVTRQTVHDWARKDVSEEFSYIYAALSQAQERRLVNGGLSSKFSAAITSMILSKHGYSSSQKIDHSNTDGTLKPTTVELISPDESSSTDS